MTDRQAFEWQWVRCSILGCGAGPLRLRRHPSLPRSWSVGFTDGPIQTQLRQVPVCPCCRGQLEALAGTETLRHPSGMAGTRV